LSAQASQARSGIVTAAIVGLGGGVVGGALFLAGAATNPNPIGAAQMRELADRYNRQLKERLGVSLVPLTSPDRAGLALDLRFLSRPCIASCSVAIRTESTSDWTERSWEGKRRRVPVDLDLDDFLHQR
jgi:hypothetical protein